MTEPRSPHPAVILLLGVIAAGVVVIAIVLLRGQAADSDRDEQRDEERRARTYFENEIDYSCTFEVQSLNDPRYQECEDRRIEGLMKQWEQAGRPEPSTID